MKYVALGELCETHIGRTPTRANPEFWGPGEPWLSIADMGYGRRISRTKEQITPVAAARGRRVQPGTVIMSFKLSIGKVGITEIGLYTNEAIVALPIKNPARLDTLYLMHALMAQDLSAEANRAAMGATLNKAALAGLQIPVPDMPEQRRIAAILDRADAIRAARMRELEALSSLAQAVFCDMFAEAPGEARHAGELMPDMRNGLSPSTKGTYSARVLTLSAITRGDFDPTAAKDGLFDIEPPPDRRVAYGDFMMCRGNGNLNLVGVGAYSLEDHKSLVFPDTVIAGRVDQQVVTVPFLDQAWKQAGVRRQIESAARTTNGTFKVNQRSLSAVLVRVPPLRRQYEFGERLNSVNMWRSKLQRLLVADSMLFASLQARAFRGEL